MINTHEASIRQLSRPHSMPECVTQELSGMDQGHALQLAGTAQGHTHFVSQLNHRLAERHRSLREGGQGTPNMREGGQGTPNMDISLETTCTPSAAEDLQSSVTMGMPLLPPSLYSSELRLRNSIKQGNPAVVIS